MLSDGGDYWIGRAPSHWPFRVHCARCRRVTMFTAQEYNRLPDYDPGQREADEERREAQQASIRAYWVEQERQKQQRQDAGSTIPKHAEPSSE